MVDEAYLRTVKITEDKLVTDFYLKEQRKIFYDKY